MESWCSSGMLTRLLQGGMHPSTRQCVQVCRYQCSLDCKRIVSFRDSAISSPVRCCVELQERVVIESARQMHQ